MLPSGPSSYATRRRCRKDRIYLHSSSRTWELSLSLRHVDCHPLPAPQMRELSSTPCSSPAIATAVGLAAAAARAHRGPMTPALGRPLLTAASTACFGRVPASQPCKAYTMINHDPSIANLKTKFSSHNGVRTPSPSRQPRPRLPPLLHAPQLVTGCRVLMCTRSMSTMATRLHRSGSSS
jgi:hypothetical protein